MNNRTELELQNIFQNQVEAVLPAGHKVVRWNSTLARLKRGSSDTEPVGHKQVLLRSDPTLGVVGLVEAIEAVNSGAFQKLIELWEQLAPGTAPTIGTLAEVAATKTATLWEEGRGNDEITRGYRLLLAYGGKAVWEQCCSFFGNDPRVLGPGDLPGWPTGLNAVSFCVVHAAEALPFLDLSIPTWVEPKRQGRALQAAAALQGTPQNAYTWVREFIVDTLGGREERADFTLFVHGLPILWTEMKSPSEGLDRAADDFAAKETYRRAPLRLLCDGSQAILTASSGGTLNKWFVSEKAIGHGTGMRVQGQNGVDAGQAYLLGQVLTHPERFEFLLRRASWFEADGGFRIARSQQYQALALWWRDLLWAACSKQNVDNRLIRHTQRTGKTHTLVRAMRLALAARGPYDAAFDMTLSMVGELPIMKSIATAFSQNDAGLLDDTAVIMEHVQSRKEFRETMDEQRKNPGMQRVILANTQKIDRQDIINDSLVRIVSTPLKTLVVLDESHLAQTGDLANARRLMLPDATHLLLTATPKTTMASYYDIASPHQTLDDFGYQQALEAGLVVPMRFERAPCAMNVDSEKLKQLADRIQAKDDDVALALEVLEGRVLDDDGPVEHKVREILARLDEELVAERLDAVVGKWVEIQEAIGRDSNGKPLFRPKAMMFCRDRRQAKAIIRWIQARNQETAGAGVFDLEANLYKGLRFGLDIADFGKGEDTLERYNPGVDTADTIKKRFESDDPDTCIDVLLAVGKYTKGYDNADLCMVALLKTVREPSLINQIYTRPATRREGKPSGVCLDLALGTGNVASWKESLALYDQEQGGLPLFDDEGVQEFRATVERHLDSAAQVVDSTWSMGHLGDAHNLGPALDRLQASGHSMAERFVAAASLACDTVRLLPDASALGGLRNPLLGIKVLLSKLRQLFPDLDVLDGTSRTGEGSGPELTLNRLDLVAFGQRIDRALAALNAPSLKHFLELSLLGSQMVDDETLGSEALLVARTHLEVQNAIAASKSLLDAYGAGSFDAEDASKEGITLHGALEAALAHLIEHAPADSEGLRDGKRMAATEHALKQVQAEIAFLQSKRPHGGFVSLLTEQIRRELDRRWLLVALPADDRPRLDSLIRLAGRRWGEDFLDWRGRMGAEGAELNAAILVRRWFEKHAADQTTLLCWLVSSQDSDTKAAVLSISSARQGYVNLLRAAMGESSADERTTGQPSLLETAAMKAGQQLAQIEANDAWTAARHAR